MQRFIIAVCISLCCIDAYSQHWPEFAEQMEWRFAQCPDAACRSKVLAEKLDSAFCSPELMRYADDVLRDMQRIHLEALPNVQSERLTWNAALLAYTNGRFKDASRWWKEYDLQTRDTSTQAYFLHFLIDVEQDSASALQQLAHLVQRDSAFVVLGDLAHARWDREARSWPYVLAAALLPGAGLVAEGYVAKGLTAFVLNSGVALAIVALLRANLYFNVATWGFMLVQKFYLGQLNLTQLLANKAHPKRLQKDKARYDQHLQMLLQHYPIAFR